MKIVFLSILIFCLSFLYTEAQSFDIYQGDTINLTDRESIKQGKWISFKKGSQIKLQEGYYLNGQKTGIWSSFYSNNKKKSEITYKKGNKKGSAKIYFENGNIAEEGTWQINKWVGKYKSYYQNGKLSYAWNYNEHGSRSGYQQYFYENGNIKIEGKWVNGKETGLIKNYYSDGSLRTEKVFNEGKIDTGSVKNYKLSEIKPVDSEVSKTDSLNISEENKIDNLKVFSGSGYHVFYNIHKKVEKDGRFINGILMEGKQYIYDAEGNLIRTMIFEKGKIIKQIQHDKIE